jgi:hypothetical protein
MVWGGGNTHVFRTTCKQTIYWGGFSLRIQIRFGRIFLFWGGKISLLPTVVNVTPPPNIAMFSPAVNYTVHLAPTPDQHWTSLFVVFQLSRSPGQNQYENVLCVRLYMYVSQILFNLSERKNYLNSTKECFLMRKLKNKTSEKSVMLLVFFNVLQRRASAGENNRNKNYVP